MSTLFSEMLETVLLVDATNLLIRGMKAMERTPLSVGDVPTGGLLVFIKSLSRYIREVLPQYVMVCWDDGPSKKRAKLFQEYKASRPERDPNSPERIVFTLAREFLTLAGIPQVSKQGDEADDLIACYWQALHPSYRVIILSGDKDFLQLLGPTTEQIRPGDDRRWTAPRVEERYGCIPQHLALVMALTGDVSDGIPGVKGIGDRRAVKLLEAVDWDIGRLLSSESMKEQYGLVMRNFHLINLRDHERATVVIPPFDPTSSSRVLYPDLVKWLNKWKMASILEQLEADTLWKRGGRVVDFSKSKATRG